MSSLKSSIHINYSNQTKPRNHDPVILYFGCDEGFGGMQKRDQQVRGLLDGIGFKVVPIITDPTSVSKLSGLIQGLRHLWIRGYRKPHRLWLVGRYGRRLAALVKTFQEYPPTSCVVWMLSNDFVIPHAAYLCGLPVIAVPMTFESFIPWTHDVLGGGTKWEKLRFEIEHLEKAQSVFCISAEEQWLLSGFGVHAHCLPYYPEDSLFQHLLGIRSRRKEIPAEHLLILSSNNPANISGVRHLVELLAQIPSELRIPTILAGHGTERYEGEFDPSVVTVEGTVDAQRLDILMAQATAFLVYQHFGTGALTRIPESLIAGIPVICNSIAARSARQYTGVYVFETADELSNLLKMDLQLPPIPPRPESAARLFIESIRSFL